jgi:hypothetical protein
MMTTGIEKSTLAAAGATAAIDGDDDMRIIISTRFGTTYNHVSLSEADAIKLANSINLQLELIEPRWAINESA